MLPDRERGQSTVEFALVLPLVIVLLLGVLQAGLVLRDQLLVSSAAREGAREAAVSAQRSRVEAAARRAAPGLSLRIDVQRGARRGDVAEVKVSAVPTAVPLVGGIVSRTTLSAKAVMRVEKAA